MKKIIKLGIVMVVTNTQGLHSVAEVYRCSRRRQLYQNSECEDTHTGSAFSLSQRVPVYCVPLLFTISHRIPLFITVCGKATPCLTGHVVTQAVGANPEDTAMTLVRTSNTAVTSPKIGAVLTWEFTIQLPTTSDMDMLVEAFVADLDTGEQRSSGGQGGHAVVGDAVCDW